MDTNKVYLTKQDAFIKNIHPETTVIEKKNQYLAWFIQNISFLRSAYKL